MYENAERWSERDVFVIFCVYFVPFLVRPAFGGDKRKRALADYVAKALKHVWD
jgi:hypothetical protein